MATGGQSKPSIDRLGVRFGQHMLRSEYQRTLALLGVLTLAAISLTIRSLFADMTMAQVVPPLIMVMSVIAYECVAARLIRGAIASGAQPRPWFWVVNILIECSLPTCGIIISWRSNIVDPEHAISAPVAFLYCVFTLLSILRLRPWLTLIGGLMCALQYLAVALWIEHEEQTLLTLPAVIAYPLVVAICGGAAFFVSSRLRESVQTGLTEASERERSEGEVDIAAKIQTGLLPTKPPVIPGYDIAGWSAAVARTGGDFYGWMPLQDGRTAVVVADVSGHGLGPAMVAVLCRAYARACMEENGELSAIVGRLNRLLSTDVPAGMFATLVVARIAADAGEIELLSAGHGPLLKLDGTAASVSTIETGGPPLGVDDAATFEPAARVSLAAGDALVLVSDGVFERRRSDGEMFGIERLRALIVDRGKEPTAAALVEAIRRAPDAFADGLAPQDDVTIVVVRRTR